MKLKTMKIFYLFVEIFELKSCQLYFGFGKKRNKLRRTRKLGKEMMKTTIHRNKQHQRRERKRESEIEPNPSLLEYEASIFWRGMRRWGKKNFFFLRKKGKLPFFMITMCVCVWTDRL